MRKYIFFAIFFIFISGTTSFELREQEDTRFFLKCQTCICDRGIKNSTNGEGFLNNQCKIKCTFECEKQEPKIDRTEGNTTRLDKNNGQIKSGNVRKALGLKTLISFLVLIVIFFAY